MSNATGPAALRRGIEAVAQDFALCPVQQEMKRRAAIVICAPRRGPGRLRPVKHEATA
jgi:hypothetical protein